MNCVENLFMECMKGKTLVELREKPLHRVDEGENAG